MSGAVEPKKEIAMIKDLHFRIDSLLTSPLTESKLGPLQINDTVLPCRSYSKGRAPNVRHHRLN